MILLSHIWKPRNHWFRLLGYCDPEIGDGFVSLLSLDMDAYAAKYGNKSVRKNLTIPAWLNTFAETEKLNVSKVLQQALTTLYEKKAAMV